MRLKAEFPWKDGFCVLREPQVMLVGHRPSQLCPPSLRKGQEMPGY